jgi:hypothetical protein
MKEALAEALKVQVPGVLEGHAGDAEGLFLFRQKGIQAGYIDVLQLFG